MNNKLNAALKWGALGALGMMIFTILLYIMNVAYDSKIRWGGFLILMLIIVLGSYEFRDKIRNGFASFGQIFSFILLLGIIYGILVSVFGFFNSQFIDTKMIDTILLENEIKFEEQGMSDVQIEQAMVWTKKVMSPIGMLIMGLLSTVISSLVIGLPTAAILNRREENYITEIHEN